MGDAVSFATLGAGIGLTVTSVATGGPLSLLWGAINSHQLIVFYPMVQRQKFPANVMLLNKAFISVATFEILPADSIAEHLFYLPEKEPISLGAKECGFESPYAILNLGTIQWIGWLKLSLVLLYLVTP